jgi:hypothetical protein
MSRKGILILVALVIGIVTGVPSLWDNADKAYFWGMGIYMLLMAWAQRIEISSVFDEIVYEINLIMCINYLVDLVAGTTQSIGINEYILFIALLTMYVPYRIRKHRKEKAAKTSGY